MPPFPNFSLRYHNSNAHYMEMLENEVEMAKMSQSYHHHQSQSPCPSQRGTNKIDSGVDAFRTDVEAKAMGDAHLVNSTVQNVCWGGLTVTVKDQKSGEPKMILENVDGVVQAGEICALMGPSGCGKTTLLNVLARRPVASGATIDGSVLVNGSTPSTAAFQRLNSYVEQEDALIGSLTVKETLHFAARLAHQNNLSKNDRIDRINKLLQSFGLTAQADTLIGTPIRKGISGGQKRRVSVASQLITDPKILFLDEPTSGLDSTASWEVMSFVKKIAQDYNLIVIASIHQPSTSTFQLFDKLLLLSAGQMHYFGSVKDTERYFDSIGFSMPQHINPAEFILELMNVDFAGQESTAHQRLKYTSGSWTQSAQKRAWTDEIEQVIKGEGSVREDQLPARNFLILLATLVHRSFVKSYRDVIAYGVRIAMYVGLAIMMGTVWLRLDTKQESIVPFTNAIFFGSAFMSFMAVAYVPSFLEDRATLIKERANGLYGATAFMLSNFIIGLPYLFFIALIFSIIAYWLSNFSPTAKAFFTWIMWLYLDLIAAESLVVLISAIFPTFVIALALTAFANGLWMSVGGFLVTPEILNPFWKYVFHYIDYQSYVFQGMLVNEFQDRNYTCAPPSTPGGTCHCMYPTELESQCKIAGTGLLDTYGYKTGKTGEWVGIMISIIIGLRLLGLGALWLRR